MHKNKFKSFLLVGLIVVLFFFATHESYIGENKIKPQPNNLEPKKKIPLNESIIKKVNEEKVIEGISDYFSSDPYINQLIILATLSDCIEYLEYSLKHKDDKHIWQSNIIRLKSREIKESLKSRFKECKRLNLKHPELDLTNKTRIKRKAFNLESRSLLQKVFKYERYLGEDEQITQQFFKELANADSRILLTANAYYAMNDYHLQYLYKIMDLLHTQQIAYAWDTVNVAQMIYSCNINGGCDGFMPQLKYQCQRDENLCFINDYNEYIKLFYSPGQQADIDILVNYIEQLFNNAKR